MRAGLLMGLLFLNLIPQQTARAEGAFGFIYDTYLDAFTVSGETSAEPKSIFRPGDDVWLRLSFKQGGFGSSYTMLDSAFFPFLPGILEKEALRENPLPVFLGKAQEEGQFSVGALSYLFPGVSQDGLPEYIIEAPSRIPFTVSARAVPEPISGSLLVLGAGMLAVNMIRRKRSFTKA